MVEGEDELDVMRAVGVEWVVEEGVLWIMGRCLSSGCSVTCKHLCGDIGNSGSRFTGVET